MSALTSPHTSESTPEYLTVMIDPVTSTAWKGRTIQQMHASDDDGNNAAAGGGGGCCCTLGAILLIAGGIMFAVANRACNDPERECNQSLRDAGEIMMITGGALIGVACACVATIICCAGCVGIASAAANK